MGTEKGRSARIRAEKEERENARVISASGFYTDAVSIREVKEYQRIKYAGLNERVSGKSYEGRLPATHLLPAEHVKERVGEYYPNIPRKEFDHTGETFPGVKAELHPSQCVRTAKKYLNMPDTTPEKVNLPGTPIPEYDPTVRMPRNGRKRPYLGDTHNKLKHKLPTTTVSE